MPGGDGTGPMGTGPATGWGRGGCMGAGRGAFPRRRFWNRFNPFYSAESTETDLQSEMSYLENIQKNITAQLAKVKEMLGTKKN